MAKKAKEVMPPDLVEEVEQDSSDLVIEEDDFRLTNVKDSKNFWDLDLKRVISPRGKEPYEKMDNYGYGMTLESAIKVIANNRISRKLKTSIDMKTYLEMYNDTVNKLSKNIYG